MQEENLRHLNDGADSGQKEIFTEKPHQPSQPQNKYADFNEKIFKLIAEFSDDWISWINPDSQISFMSPRCRLISGYDPGEFGDDSQFLKRIIHPKDLNKFVREESKMLEGMNFFSDEFRIIKKNGEVKWISLVCQNVYDINNYYLGRYLCIKDITDKMSPNVFLLNKETLAKEIYDDAEIGYYEIFYDGNLKSANKIFLSMLGYENIGSLPNRVFEEYCVLNKEKREEFKSHLRKNGRVKDFESEWIRKDWSIGYFRESANTVTIGGVLQPYYQVLVHDITALKNAEYAYLTALSKKRKIEELKAEFLATMSHEIRTPLNVIMNMVQLLKNESGFNESVETNHSIKIIEEEGERIKRTIDLILEMAQLQTGTYEKIISEVDLYDDVLKQIYKSYSARAKAKNIEFILTNKILSPKIIADKYGLEQIFKQLIDNSFKYTTSGKIETTVYMNEEEQIVVEVEDTGIGIKEEYIPFLFEVFSQEDNSYSRLFEGTGLGLAIVKKHCELNNAVVDVESIKNIGSKFRVRFLEKVKEENSAL